MKRLIVAFTAALFVLSLGAPVVSGPFPPLKCKCTVQLTKAEADKAKRDGFIQPTAPQIQQIKRVFPKYKGGVIKLSLKVFILPGDLLCLNEQLGPE